MTRQNNQLLEDIHILNKYQQDTVKTRQHLNSKHYIKLIKQKNTFFQQT